jgi:16S rRNA (adenine1518-N6/adenine1519-N6)-dimethyltransferase
MHHHPRKRFGQNFLHDRAVVQRILAAVDAQPDQHLVEVGPGQGAITGGLLAAAGELDAIELDRELIGPLASRFATAMRAAHASTGDAGTGWVPGRQREAGETRFRLHNADALAFDLCALLPRTRSASRPEQLSPADARQAAPRLRLVGNLPYNISTPLLFRFLEQADCIEDMHLMLQKEVVDRMTATPGTKVYGRLSVMVQTHCSAERLFVVRSGAFRPAPKVDSAVVRLRPHRPPAYRLTDRRLHQRIVAAAFSQRRKILRNSLRGLVAGEQFAALGLDPGARAERLAVADFVVLANAAAACIDAEIP